MCSRLTQRRRQLLVLGHRLGELPLGLEQTLLERPDALGRVLETPSQDDDLLLESLDALLELIDLSFVLGQPPLVLGSHLSDTSSVDGDHSPAFRPDCAHPIRSLADSSREWICHFPM
jgi:hypothetical protein